MLSLSIIGGHLYACMGNGWCQRWCASFVSSSLWQAHDRIGLSCVVTSALGHEYHSQTQGEAGKAMLVTGGADSSIKVSQIAFGIPVSNGVCQLWLIDRPPAHLGQGLEETSQEVESESITMLLV